MGDATVNRKMLHGLADALTDSEVAEVLDYINIMEAMRQQANQPGVADDDLLNVLADALENRRARVVAEWESVRRRADRRANALVSSRLVS